MTVRFLPPTNMLSPSTYALFRTWASIFVPRAWRGPRSRPGPQRIGKPCRLAAAFSFNTGKRRALIGPSCQKPTTGCTSGIRRQAGLINGIGVCRSARHGRNRKGRVALTGGWESHSPTGRECRSDGVDPACLRKSRLTPYLLRDSKQTTRFRGKPSALVAGWNFHRARRRRRRKVAR
jgi:hypothetical protein